MQYKITYGGWYQRTTLHLSEIYELFSVGTSQLNLPKIEVKKFQEKLQLENVSRESGYFEYVRAKTQSGIEIRYYEDGLYVLETESDDVTKSKKLLEEYFKNKLNTATSYIFSLDRKSTRLNSSH